MNNFFQVKGSSYLYHNTKSNFLILFLKYFIKSETKFYITCLFRYSIDYKQIKMLNSNKFIRLFLSFLIVCISFSCNQNSSSSEATDSSPKVEKKKRPKTPVSDRPSTVNASTWLLNEFGTPKMAIKTPVQMTEEKVDMAEANLDQIEKIQFWSGRDPNYKIDNISATVAKFDTEGAKGDSTLFLTMIASSRETIKEFTKAKQVRYDHYQNAVKINESPGILQVINVADSINFYNAFFLKNSYFYHLGLVGRNEDLSNDACNEIIASINID